MDAPEPGADATIDRSTGSREQETAPEFPPGYENTPVYSAEGFHEPLATYHLRVTKPNLLHLVPFLPGRDSYAISYRSTTALPIFNRKGDISIARKPANSTDPSNEHAVSRADFWDCKKLPYRPAAKFALKSKGNARETTVEMESQDWKNWTFGYDSPAYVWTLREAPACIELSSTASRTSPEAAPVIARFVYGKVGTKVQAGGEAGTLAIWRDALTHGQEGMDVVVTGCLVVVKYFDGLGRKYRNDGFGGATAAAVVNAKAQETNKVRNKIMLF